MRPNADSEEAGEDEAADSKEPKLEISKEKTSTFTSPNAKSQLSTTSPKGLVMLGQAVTKEGVLVADKHPHVDWPTEMVGAINAPLLCLATTKS